MTRQTGDGDGERNGWGDTFVTNSVVPWNGDPWRSPVDVIPLTVLVGWFWYAAGLRGFAVGMILALLWLVLPNVGVFAAGGVALTATVPEGVPLAVVAVPALALAGLLVTTPVGVGRFGEVSTVLVIWGVLAGVAWAMVVATGTVWVAGLVVLVAALAGYVSLDLILLSRVGSGIDE